MPGRLVCCANPSRPKTHAFCTSSNSQRRDPEAAAFVRSVADENETVPTVTVAGKAMVNPSKRQLLDEVRTRTPHLPPATGKPTGERD